MNSKGEHFMLQLNGELLNLIDHTVKKTTIETVAELKRQNLIVEGRQTPFQKTETLLFNYNQFKAAIRDKEEQIREIKEVGLAKKSACFSTYSCNDGYVEVKSDEEKAEEKIERIEMSIKVTKNFIKIIDDAISSLRDDPYYLLIDMRYFKGYTREQIADYFDCDVSTINRNKNRLINLLQIRLFSDEVIQQIFMG
jgi:RNA polymerase sigma factor (sigma-70 family)